MKLENMPRMYEADIEDVRKDAVKRPKNPTDQPVESGKGDLEVTDKTVIFSPDDIGEEMQPVMRGYGKVQKNIRQWRVR
jgi:hypothetical protein